MSYGTLFVNIQRKFLLHLCFSPFDALECHNKFFSSNESSLDSIPELYSKSMQLKLQFLFDNFSTSTSNVDVINVLKNILTKMSFNLLTEDFKAFLQLNLYEKIRYSFNIKSYDISKKLLECLLLISFKLGSTSYLKISYQILILLHCILEDYQKAGYYNDELLKLSVNEMPDLLMLTLNLLVIINLESNNSIPQVLHIMKIVASLNGPSEELYYVFHEILIINLNFVDISFALQMFCDNLAKENVSLISICLETIVSYLVTIYNHFNNLQQKPYPTQITTSILNLLNIG